jgi:hypothetical protein
MRAAPVGYTLGKLLHSGRHSEVWEAVLDSDRSEVVIKSYHADRATDARPRALREFEAMRRIAGAGIPRPIALDRSTERVLLVLERLRGTPLAQILQQGPLEIERWLDLALRMTEILVQIHAARVLHKDLTPGNLLLDRSGEQVWICDFGLAQELGAAAGGSPLAGTLEGTLQYLAPEQTGRMNRGCDFRSDLYSVGATLYHALTGRPPFESSDALELIHAHIARIPEAPAAIRSDVPPALSSLLLRLLRKEPEERYQSAAALRNDLARCKERLASGASLGADFELATSEGREQPRFAVKLYGREREVELLRTHYASAAAGQVRALWLHGEAGAGKSTLIDALRPELARTGGYLTVGKADPYRDRPYDAWLSALGGLAHQMLIESDARLGRWRRELCAGLGNIAGALVALVPDLSFILGEVAPVPALGPRETQARLSLALQRFVSICATPQHPLVVFLDDLQWSDAGSRALLEGLLSSGEPAALLLVGAYRSGDVDVSHPLASLFTRVAQLGAACDALELGPLARDAVVAMLGDALDQPAGAVQSLAELIERKTGNTPLLVRQFVEHIHARGLLQRRAGAGWSWDAAEVAAADIPDGAVELMTAKIEKLLPELGSLLELASCVGDEFDLELLSGLSTGLEREALERALFALSDAGLIAPCARGFRFVHDRIREAAQQLLPEQERARIHFDTARLLLARTPASERDAHVFEIVEHLNRGLVHISEELRVTAIELDLQAGTRALAAGAGATACGYLGVARMLFRDDDWRAHWSIGFPLYLQSAEGCFQTQQFDQALALLDVLDRHSLTPIESTQVAIKRLQVLALTQGASECGPYVLSVLRRLGVRWPLHPSRLRGWLAIQWVRHRLHRRSDEGLLEPAQHVDPLRRATQLFINASGGVRSRIDAELSVLASCLSMRRALRRGYIGSPGFTLAGYTVFMHARVGDCALSRRLARIALELSERVPDPVQTPRVQFMIHTLLEPWLMRRRHALAPMDRTAQAVSEAGDREFEYYSRFLMLLYRGLGGDPIPQTAELMQQLGDSIRRSGHFYPTPEAVLGVYRMLAEEIDDAELERRLADSERWIASNGNTELFVRTAWLLVLCVRGRHELALAQSDAVATTLFRVTPYVHVADHTFLRGLCTAALAGAARGQRRRQLQRDLRRSLRRLRTWAREGPDFAPLQALLEAEMARLDANPQGARVLYERAAQGAAQQEFPHVAALAYERHARMLIEARRETEAASALKDAIAWYRKWGAVPKVEALLRERQRLLSE